MSGAIFVMSIVLSAAAADADPVADPRAVIVSGQARFTLLTPMLVRLEWSPSGRFEDRASLAFVNRRLPVPYHKTATKDGWLIIDTEGLSIRYKENSGGFTEDNLSVSLRATTQPVVWKPGKPDLGNLLGTTRTLDSVSGRCPLEPGLLSRDGWVVVDDSKRPLLDDSEWPWAQPRPEPGAIDWYFFGYAREYKLALRDFTRIAGRIPLPPRFVFGSWWSRYWAYSDAELRRLVAEFREHDVPLDVLVIDMDWHLEGWTGYTWNPAYFPDPAGFLSWCREQGLKVTLNLHPADGVGRHEKVFPDFARRLGLDPDKLEKVPFDCTDRRFVAAYFALLHHPLERQGVDFWWIDWQQGTETRVPGLDPLTWLNYLHWTDMERNPDNKGRRPLIFSRWGGLGNHRYQIGFSGDTYCNWPSLAFQPFFTATAGNVGYAYWSHDIGGHQPGPVEPELYARWIQWGALSPVLRTHTTKNPDAERRIWAFPKQVFEAARKAFHLRYELIPYIYTAARKAFDEALPLCRPLYYEWPYIDEAYTREDGYLFGDDLLVRPVTSRIEPAIGGAATNVWFPPGQWIDWFTGRAYFGPSATTLLVPLDEIPMFVKSGAVIPAAPRMRHTGERPLDPLILHVFPGPNSKSRIYDDDGRSVGYIRHEYAMTPVNYEWRDGWYRLSIGRTVGHFVGMPDDRRYEIRLHGVWPAEEVRVNGEALRRLGPDEESGFTYDDATFSIVVRLARRKLTEVIDIAVRTCGLNGADGLVYEGLPGFVRLLESVQETLGERTPIAVRRGTSIRKQVLSKPADAIESARFLRDNLVRLVSDIVAAAKSPETARPLIARTLGLSWTTSVRVPESAPGQIALTTRIEASPPFGRISEVPVRLSLEPVDPGGEAVPGSTVLLAPTIPYESSTLVSLGQSPKTRVLRGTLELRLPGASLEWPIEQTVLPSINAWWIVGPFDSEFSSGLTTVFPPEEKIDLKAIYKGQGGARIAWREVRREVREGSDVGDEFRVAFDHVFGGRVYGAVAYGLVYLHAPRDMQATLAIGSDDGAAMWLNGREVYRRDVGRAYASRQDRAPIELKQGPNTLLVKVKQGGGDWSFCVHVEDAQGRPLPEVEARLEP